MISFETGLLATLSLFAGLLVSLPLIGWFTSIGIELAEPMNIGGISMSHLTGEMSLYVFGLPLLLIIIFAMLISIPAGIRAARISPTEAMRSN